MTMPVKNKRSGTTIIEFVLVGVPVIFLVISIFEVARGMWVYQTLSHATHVVARHIAVHGSGCGGTNTCALTLGAYAHDFTNVAPGMDASLISATFYSQNTSIACSPITTCYNDSTAWPPSGDNGAGSDVRIASKASFPNALTMFWPGSRALPFSSLYFSAYSRQRILF